MTRRATDGVPLIWRKCVARSEGSVAGISRSSPSVRLSLCRGRS